MSASKFKRLFPDWKVLAVVPLPKSKQVRVEARMGEDAEPFQAVAKTEEEAIAKVSANILRYAGRMVMRAQNYEDKNTGMIRPLQAHHVVPRSKGPDHSPNNLAGVSLEVHEKQHSTRGKQ
jgi:hypothetical protein